MIDETACFCENQPSNIVVFTHRGVGAGTRQTGRTLNVDVPIGVILCRQQEVHPKAVPP
jgi:hypothetical protein